MAKIKTQVAGFTNDGNVVEVGVVEGFPKVLSASSGNADCLGRIHAKASVVLEGVKNFDQGFEVESDVVGTQCPVICVEFDVYVNGVVDHIDEDVNN